MGYIFKYYKIYINIDDIILMKNIYLLIIIIKSLKDVNFMIIPDVKKLK